MVVPAFVAGSALALGGLRHDKAAVTAVGAVLLAVSALMLNFFRDFDRKVPPGAGPKSVVSPADGLVTRVEVVDEPMHLKAPCLQVAIFMNPLDNHVQRVPFDGKVLAKDYYPGEYLAAYKDKADLVNEQCHVTVELSSPGKGRMVLKQIAGFLCHRVKTDVAAGDVLTRGMRFGRILLGSRVDVFLPENFKPSVKVGDRVKAGETVLGELP